MTVKSFYRNILNFLYFIGQKTDSNSTFIDKELDQVDSETHITGNLVHLVVDGLMLKPFVLFKLLRFVYELILYQLLINRVESVKSVSVGLSSKGVPVIRIYPKKDHATKNIKANVVKKLKEAIWELHKVKCTSHELARIIEINQEEEITMSRFDLCPPHKHAPQAI